MNAQFGITDLDVSALLVRHADVIVTVMRIGVRTGERTAEMTGTGEIVTTADVINRMYEAASAALYHKAACIPQLKYEMNQ